MTFNVNDFRSSFKHDPLVANKFRVEVSPPVSMFNVSDDKYNIARRELSWRAKSAELPSKILATYEQRDHGPVSTVVYDASYAETTIEFILTESFMEKNFFTLWMEFIIDNEDSEFSDDERTGGTGYVEYYDRYKGQIKIDVFSNNGFPIHTTILRDAYPLAVSPINASWDSSEPATVSVQFKYKRFDTVQYKNNPSDPARLGELVNSPDLPLSGLEILNGGIDQAISTIDAIIREKQNLKNIVTTTKNRIETGKAQLKGLREKVKSLGRF